MASESAIPASSAVLHEHIDELQQEVRRQAQALQASEARYRLLLDLGQLLSSSLSLREIFERAATEVRRLTGCDRVSLITVDRDARTRQGFALEFGGTPRWLEVPPQELDGTAAQWALQQRRTRIARQLDQARPFPEDRSLFAQGYRAYLYLPLVVRNEGAGVLGLAARQEEQLDHWDVGLLRELCSVLAAALCNAAAYTQIAQLKAQLEENRSLREERRPRRGHAQIIGDSRAMQEVRRAIAQVAGTDSSVLIVGETGTGKELIAQAIHDASPRREQLLVKVNCAALTPTLLTSELFGHEAGAFSGASKRRIGRFERASGGTIFLDEIAEVSAETQVLLLRVLQERVIERVGGTEPIGVNVRVLAATNCSLEAARDAGTFRADLFYRLHVFPIHVPPLRERREDIPDLIDHFVTRFSERMNKPIAAISPRTLDLAQSYPWPGNVRELENLIERAMIVSMGDTLDVDPHWLPAHAEAVDVPDAAPSLAEQERQAIRDALRRAGGKIYGPTGAAALLGLKPTTLYGKMRKHRIPRHPGKTSS